MGQGIRADARDELKRQSALRQDSAAAFAMLETLVGELREAEVPASLTHQKIRYGDSSLTAILSLPPIHYVEGGAVPPWPEEIPAMVSYSVTVHPTIGVADVEGPLAVLPDGTPDPDEEDDRRDPIYLERFKTGGEAGFKNLSGLVARVRELAIMREVAIQSSIGAPAP